MALKKITVTVASTVTNDTLQGYNFYSSVQGKLNVSVVTPANATAGVEYNLTDGVSHDVTARPVGTTNGEFTAVNSSIVVVDLTAPAPSVMFTNANTTISAGTAFVAGTPNKFESSATNQFLKHNTLKSGAFSMRMFITDIFTKSIGFGLDDADNNTDPIANWNVYVQVAESYAIKVGGALVDPTVPTTITAGAGRYVRLSRTASGSSILLHYFDGTSEILVHTFAAASGASVLKANIVSSSRKIYDIQTT